MTAVDTCEACGRGRPLELQMTTKSGRVLTIPSATATSSRTVSAPTPPAQSMRLAKIAAGVPRQPWALPGPPDVRETSRLHPNESIVLLVRLFRSQHRHDLS